MKPTVVTLSGTPEGTTQVQFEEIFGEYSEARGRGRERKRNRKLTKKETRRLNKLARIKKRADAQKARQEKHTAHTEMAQARRLGRKGSRVQRKALGKEEEGLEEDGMENQVQEKEQAQPLNQEGDSAPDNQGNGEGEYQTTQEGDVEAGEQEEQQTEEGSEEQGQGDEEVDAEVDGEQDQSDEDSGFTGSSGINGVVEMSEEDKIWNEYFSSASGRKKINPKVRMLSRRIEILKHKIKRAERKVNKDQTHLNKLKARLANMVNKLAGYAKFDGDYSDAKGGRSQVARRKAEVRHAKAEARQERKAVAKAEAKLTRAEKRAETPRAIRKANRAEKIGVTEVEQGLNPDIQENEIVVPSEEVTGVDGNQTGLIGLDAINDADAPEVRVFDLNFSNASGDTKPKIDIKNVAIGIGVGVLAVYLIKKYAK